MNLTSVKMQTIIFGNDFDNEYSMPMVRFGRGKGKVFKFNLAIKKDDEAKINECWTEIMKHKGKSFEEIQAIHQDLCLRFNQYEPKKGKKKTNFTINK
jgi:hypothetical protein